MLKVVVMHFLRKTTVATRREEKTVVKLNLTAPPLTINGTTMEVVNSYNLQIPGGNYGSGIAMVYTGE